MRRVAVPRSAPSIADSDAIADPDAIAESAERSRVNCIRHSRDYEPNGNQPNDHLIVARLVVMPSGAGMMVF